MRVEVLFGAASVTPADVAGRVVAVDRRPARVDLDRHRAATTARAP